MHRSSAACVCAGAALGAICSTVGRRSARSLKIKQILGSNAVLFSSQERDFVRALVQAGHGYLFRDWPPAGVKDEAKRRLLQVAARSLKNGAEEIRRGLIEVPRAAKKHHIVEAPHGKQRSDPYYWLRDDERTAKDVINYLEAENKYTQSAMADTYGLQKELFAELRGRIQEEDETAPVRRGEYFWYSRTEEGKQYSIYCRRPCRALGSPTEADAIDLSLPEEILIDANEEAKPHAFYMLGSFEISPDQSMVAYECDVTGNEKFSLYVKAIQTGEQQLVRPVQNTAGGVAWSRDNGYVFYVTKDAVLRPDKVWRHKIGSDPESDLMVYHEEDASFNVGVELSHSKNHIFIETSAAVTSETLMLDASNPEGSFKIIIPRANDVEYAVHDWNNFLFMLIRDTNRPNCELVVAPMSNPTQQTVLVQHDGSIKLEGVVVSQNYLTVFQRKNAQQTALSFRLPDDGSIPQSLGQGAQLQFDEPAYSLRPGQQGDFESDVLRVVYSSLTTPPTVIDQHLGTQARATKKVEPVRGFTSTGYKSDRLWAKAGDGKQIPISIVYKTDLVKLDGSDPLLLDGYGSYGICNNPRFDRDLVSLLDRGFIYAIAHVRGGGELGRAWYEDGKYKKKKNTFTDFIAAAESLISKKYTSSHKLCIQGRSAGGLLIGAVLNMRPDLFQAAILGVPFVDVVTTMLDESIPLTTGEFEEWGNPAKEDYYDYMLSYSPVDQVHPGAYPHTLVLAGLHDPRVAYWEPAKFTAKLRDLKTDDNLLLFKCDMGAGHFSQSGRFDQLHDVALEHAFLLKAIDTSRS